MIACTSPPNEIPLEKSNQIPFEKSNQIPLEKSNEIPLEKSNQIPLEKSFLSWALSEDDYMLCAGALVVNEIRAAVLEQCGFTVSAGVF